MKSIHPLFFLLNRGNTVIKTRGEPLRAQPAEGVLVNQSHKAERGVKTCSFLMQHLARKKCVAAA